MGGPFPHQFPPDGQPRQTPQTVVGGAPTGPTQGAVPQPFAISTMTWVIIGLVVAVVVAMVAVLSWLFRPKKSKKRESDEESQIEPPDNPDDDEGPPYPSHGSGYASRGPRGAPVRPSDPRGRNPQYQHQRPPAYTEGSYARDDHYDGYERDVSIPDADRARGPLGGGLQPSKVIRPIPQGRKRAPREESRQESRSSSQKQGFQQQITEGADDVDDGGDVESFVRGKATQLEDKLIATPAPAQRRQQLPPPKRTVQTAAVPRPAATTTKDDSEVLNALQDTQ
jgi:hypothetical protein